jgi:hypothetical protein
LENLEGLKEKVGTLGLQTTRKRRCGAAKKWARKAKLAEAPTGDCWGPTSVRSRQSATDPAEAQYIGG